MDESEGNPMTKDDFQTMWKMLIGIWPKLDTDETIAAWWGLLGHYPAHHATSSVRKWATERRAAPAPSDIIEGIKAILNEQSRTNRRTLSRASCDECEGTGFVWRSFDGQGTVARCRRGCMPPTDFTPEAVASTNRANPTHYRERLDAVITAKLRKRADLGESEYLRANGYDPKHYRISHGMIIARERT